MKFLDLKERARSLRARRVVGRSQRGGKDYGRVWLYPGGDKHDGSPLHLRTDDDVSVAAKAIGVNAVVRTGVTEWTQLSLPKRSQQVSGDKIGRGAEQQENRSDAN
jgi:hypothetical protein